MLLSLTDSAVVVTDKQTHSLQQTCSTQANAPAELTYFDGGVRNGLHIHYEQTGLSQQDTQLGGTERQHSSLPSQLKVELHDTKTDAATPTLLTRR